MTEFQVSVPSEVAPTGRCFCGCGGAAEPGRYFLAHHDRKAETAVLAARYDGSIAKFVVAHGFGPDSPPVPVPVDADGVELHVGDRVLANGRRGVVCSVRPGTGIAVFDSDDGTRRSAQFRKFVHV